MKKSIDVVVNIDDSGCIHSYRVTNFGDKCSNVGIKTYNAVLTWEEPEKKVEITESEFDIIWNGKGSHYDEIKNMIFNKESK